MPVFPPPTPADNTVTVTAGAVEHPTPTNDTLLVRIVAVSLAVIVLSSLVSIVVLVLSGVTIPDVVFPFIGGLGTTALGGLAAMLVSTASRRQ